MDNIQYHKVSQLTALTPPTLSTSNHSFYQHVSQIKKLIQKNILFIYDELMELTVLNLNKNNQIALFDIILQNSLFFDVFYFNSYFYLIIKSDFIKFQYDSISLKLKKVESAQNNLNNTNFTKFKIAFRPFNKAINVGYDYQTQKMYPIYLCPDNQQYNFTTNLCEDIPCTINNCEQCKLNENICTACIKHQNLISQSILICSYRCQIDNCYMCGQSNTCKICQINYQYNQTLNLCLLSSSNIYNQIQNNYNNLDSSVFQFENI